VNHNFLLLNALQYIYYSTEIEIILDCSTGVVTSCLTVFSLPYNVPHLNITFQTGAPLGLVTAAGQTSINPIARRQGITFFGSPIKHAPIDFFLDFFPLWA
jgi:hypothetical protein